MTSSTEQMSLKALLKTIEGELQSALYYNSNAIFAKQESEIYFYTRKVHGILDGIKAKIEDFEDWKNKDGSSNPGLDSK